MGAFLRVAAPPFSTHPLPRPGRLPFRLCTRLDLLNNRSPYCLLLLPCVRMCTAKRGGHYSSACVTARAPGEPRLVRLCHSAGLLLSFATFLFLCSISMAVSGSHRVHLCGMRCFTAEGAAAPSPGNRLARGWPGACLRSSPQWSGRRAPHGLHFLVTFGIVCS